jgi:chromate reductase
MATMRILAICGSLRKASYNRLALNALAELAPADVEIDVCGLDDIPIFSQDVFDESGFPPAVAALRSAIAAADGVIIGTPEYYHSFPGVLKNAIDFAGSKPPVFGGKPVAIMSSAPSVHGGSRAQYDLRKVLQALDALVLTRPEIFIGRADQKFDSAGRLSDETTRTALAEFLAAFRTWIVRLQTPDPAQMLAAPIGR